MFDKIPESNVLMNSYGIVVPQNQRVSKWHKGRHWKKVFIRRLENGYPRMLFASITLQGAGLSSVNFVNIPFSISKGRFLLFNPLLNAGGRHKFAGYWKHQHWAPLSCGSMEFSAFLVFVVWTSSMTYLTFGKGEWQTANHFLSLYSLFSPSYLISITLSFYFADLQQWMQWAYKVSF